MTHFLQPLLLLALVVLAAKLAGYGLANGLIDRDVFSASVIMVLATTMVTPPLLRHLFPRRHGEAVLVEETIAGPPEAAEAS